MSRKDGGNRTKSDPEIDMTERMKDITVSAGGKWHPAVQMAGGSILMAYKCPGSQNGQLAASAQIVAYGHELANCRETVGLSRRIAALANEI
jgi:hypothetical protein